MSRSLRRKIAFLILLACSTDCHARQDHHRYEAPLQAVPEDGFYRIWLTPEITGRCSTPWQDVRIKDRQNRQVPYLLDGHPARQPREIVFPVSTALLDTARQYYVVLQNPSRYALDHLTLRIAQTEATRSLTLSGSDDQRTWYAIREDFYWEQSTDRSRSITFPLTAYRYFKIVFNGAGKLPIQVLSASTYVSEAAANAYFPVPAPRIFQKDSSRRSFITLLFDHPYLISRLQLTMTGPRYFHRTATVDVARSGNNAYPAATAELSSGTQAIMLGGVTDRVSITIDNEDNPPVKISACQAFQEAHHLTAFLEKEAPYLLTFGDSTAGRPVYDLTYFRDSIGGQPPVLGIGAVQKAATIKRPAMAPADSGKWLIWVVLAALLAGLLYMSMRLMKQLNGKQD